MIRRTIRYSRDALEDLRNIYDWIAGSAGPATADAYIGRLQRHVAGLELASQRGALRTDIRPDLRVIGFERRVTIVFVVDAAQVVILRLAYAGQNWERSVTPD